MESDIVTSAWSQGPKGCHPAQQELLSDTLKRRVDNWLRREVNQEGKAFQVYPMSFVGFKFLLRPESRGWPSRNKNLFAQM